MKNIGGILLFLGLGSTVLFFFNYELSYLMWIENWGTSIGWGIRIGFAVLGAILLLVARKQSQSAS